MRWQWLLLVAFTSIALLLLLLFNLSSLPAGAATILLPGKLAAASSRPSHEFSLLIGIVTRPDLYERRHLLRLVYGTQSSPIAEIHVKFVFCRLANEEQRLLVGLEILRYDDVIILNCTENKIAGKTHTYLSSLPAILPRRYDYVMKADDDIFIRLHPLAASLRPLPRRDLYYGLKIPCARINRPFVEYMSGMGFVVSWDIVEWVAALEVAERERMGSGDKLLGRWMAAAGKGKHRFNGKPGMYDYPGSSRTCAHELIPETVAVHRLKEWDKWLHVLSFFNVTKGLKPSKLYHID